MILTETQKVQLRGRKKLLMAALMGYWMATSLLELKGWLMAFQRDVLLANR